jgi:hypothetical protein
MNMNDYVDVAERIAQLKEAYPEASLQPYNPNKPYDIVQVEGKTYVVYTAACYRDPHDVRPGVAVAWEQIPGKGMTAGSELMICETSAWGRAIVAAMKSATKRVASKQEVIAAKERQTWAVTPTEKLNDELLSRPVKEEPVKAIYGRPGSKSALMERVLRERFAEDNQEQNTDPTPLTLDQVVDAVATDVPAVQHCQHGEMQLRTGIAKGRGVPYYGYVCPAKVCDARWASRSKEGKWFYPGANNG